MHILITNDDGVTAPGLAALAQEMKPLGKVTVLAPDHNWSASGHVKTLDRPLRVKELPAWDGVQVFASDGAPSDCVALAVLGILSEKIDLVVSGINPNANLGHDVTYSGTVTAAMEAAIWEIPGIAVSLNAPENHLGGLDYGPAARIGRQVAAQVIANGLAQATLLNVNVPYLPYEQIKGILFTRQGMRLYRDALVARNDPRGRPYYWIGGEAPTGIPDEGTDFGALARGFVSITPLQMDMTAYRVMDNLRTWKFE